MVDHLSKSVAASRRETLAHKRTAPCHSNQSVFHYFDVPQKLATALKVEKKPLQGLHLHNRFNNHTLGISDECSCRKIAVKFKTEFYQPDLNLAS